MSSSPARRGAKRRSSGAKPGSRRSTAKSNRFAADGRSALERDALQRFRMIFGTARRHDAEVRRIAGISGSQLWALSEIARAKAMRVNDLAEQMALHQTTASNLVNALVERRLIRRVRDEADQRVVRLHITVDGKRMLLRAPGPYTGLLVDALRHLDADQLEKLRKSLSILTAVIRDAATDTAGETMTGE